MPFLVVAALIAVLLLARKGGQMNLGPGIPSRAAQYMGAAIREAQRYGIDEAIFCSLIDRESDWNPNAIRNEPQVDAERNVAGVQPDASRGLCQVLLRTVRALGYTGDGDMLFDPDLNLHYGAVILGDAYRRRGNYQDALAEYNSGKSFANAPEHTRTVYVPEILRDAEAKYRNALAIFRSNQGLA